MPLTVKNKTADQFVQGTAMLDALPRDEALDLLTGVTDLGGTTFDLAHAYGGGVSETLMGEWMRQHGVRDELFLITKGGHPADGRRRIGRKDVRSDLAMSLDRLGTDYIDLYLLHRDDEDVPVDEIVTFFDELFSEGLIRAYGGSNWRHERFEAAREYARRNNLCEPLATSPHFSLAVPTQTPWPGCVSIAGEEGTAARAYYARDRIPVLAWSSLAMGYFALGNPDDDAGKVPHDPSTTGMGREQSMSQQVFSSPMNDSRRERARSIARAHGDTPTQVAFRYALSTTLVVHPIVGCRTSAEYAALQEAARRPLSAAEVRWLEEGSAG